MIPTTRVDSPVDGPSPHEGHWAGPDAHREAYRDPGDPVRHHRLAWRAFRKEAAEVRARTVAAIVPRGLPLVSDLDGTFTNYAIIVRSYWTRGADDECRTVTDMKQVADDDLSAAGVLGW